MSDPNPVAADPAPVPAPATVLPALIEAYPACFDWEQPRPLKIGIHQDLVAAGFEKAAFKRALGRYCNRLLYRRVLQTDALRIDLQGQPAGAVTEREAAHARSRVQARAAARAAARESLPPNATPIPEAYRVPGRLELTVKFSELPRPLAVRDGLKIGLQNGEGIVTAILPPKVWRKLEQAAKDYPHWVATLSGSLDRFATAKSSSSTRPCRCSRRRSGPRSRRKGRGQNPTDRQSVRRTRRRRTRNRQTERTGSRSAGIERTGSHRIGREEAG